MVEGEGNLFIIFRSGEETGGETSEGELIPWWRVHVVVEGEVK